MKCLIVLTSISFVLTQSSDSNTIILSIDFQRFDFQFIYFIIVVSVILLAFIYLWVRLLTNTSIFVGVKNPLLKFLICLVAPCYSCFKMFRPIQTSQDTNKVPKKEVEAPVQTIISTKKPVEMKKLSSIKQKSVVNTDIKTESIKKREEIKSVKIKPNLEIDVNEVRSVKIITKPDKKDELNMSNIVIEEQAPVIKEGTRNVQSIKDSTKLLVQNFTETEKSTRTTSTPDLLPVSRFKYFYS